MRSFLRCSILIYDHNVDVMLLREAWHDVDSVAIRHLRAYGFTAVERVRPRCQRAEKSLGVHHGGVQSGTLSCIAVVIKRPGFLCCYQFIFTSRRYASEVYAVVVCPSVCLSVTRRYCLKPAQSRITQATPYDSQGTL